MLWERQKIHKNQDSITTVNTYKPNGLLDNINRNGEVTTYIYDTKNRAQTIEIVGKNKQTMEYDNFDRVTKLTENIENRSYIKQVEYDVLGRVRKEIFPSGYFTYNVYDTYGNLVEVKDNANRSIWKALEENARGQLTKSSKGGKQSIFGFDERGLPTSIFAQGVVDAGYHFDAKGNLEYRTDNLTVQKEEFQYDGQNRLTNWDVFKNNALVKQNNIVYDPTTGNIQSKSDLGNFTFSYGEVNGKPHALTSISGAPVMYQIWR